MERKFEQKKAALRSLSKVSSCNLLEELPEHCNRIYLPDGEKEFLAFRIQDDSVAPVFRMGDLVLCSLSNAVENMAAITDNEVYVVIAKDGTWVKRARKYLDKDGNWTHTCLLSINTTNREKTNGFDNKLHDKTHHKISYNDNQIAQEKTGSQYHNTHAPVFLKNHDILRMHKVSRKLSAF